MEKIAREMERNRKEHERQMKAAERERTRQIKEAQRKAELAKKEKKERYQSQRVLEANKKNSKVIKQIEEIERILQRPYLVDPDFIYQKLKKDESYPVFTLPSNLAEIPKKPEIGSFTNHLQAPKGIKKMVPGAQKAFEAKLEDANRQFSIAFTKYAKLMEERERKIAILLKKYEDEKIKKLQLVREHNEKIDLAEKQYKEGDPDQIIELITHVIRESVYPIKNPKEFRVNYRPEPKELLVEYELPKIAVIPSVMEYRYIKIRDEITHKLRPGKVISQEYQGLIAALTLRTIKECFFIDKYNNIDVISFNGMQKTVDPATGHSVRPCLISIRVTKEQFDEINLERVDKIVCLRNLGAVTSPRPEESVAIKPVVEFDMYDKRFIESGDTLSQLDSRPNIMDLNPWEFEELITNLFEKIGFETRLTQASRDGGVDCVAFDTRPIVGGKVVIQAKRYKDVVGVSAARDLYGTLVNEGANKGILVTTSHFGKATYDFCKGKPIEMIDGQALLYLLKENGFEAKIIMPEE